MVELVEPESVVADESGLAGAYLGLPSKPNGRVKSILGWGEHWWDRLGAVYASDVCQFRDI